MGLIELASGNSVWRGMKVKPMTGYFCLSLDGVRPCTRYKEIEVDYLDQDFKLKHGKYNGFTAQIIQHEIDHFSGVLI